jgi:hypothetical protein
MKWNNARLNNLSETWVAGVKHGLGQADMKTSFARLLQDVRVHVTVLSSLLVCALHSLPTNMLTKF